MSDWVRPFRSVSLTRRACCSRSRRGGGRAQRQADCPVSEAVERRCPHPAAGLGFCPGLGQLAIRCSSPSARCGRRSSRRLLAQLPIEFRRSAAIYHSSYDVDREATHADAVQARNESSDRPSVRACVRAHRLTDRLSDHPVGRRASCTCNVVMLTRERIGLGRHAPTDHWPSSF